MEVFGEVIAPNGRTRAPPFVLGAKTKLTFESVPYGRGLVAEVRMYPPGTDGEGDNPLYFGRSLPFDLEPGVDLIVGVAIGLSPGPGLDSDALFGPAVRILEADDGFVRAPEVIVEVRAKGAERLLVAQDFLFNQGRVEVEAAQVQAEERDGLAIYRFPYDLNDTLPECNRAEGGDPDLCEGPRQVVVRALAAGFQSEPSGTAVTLDTKTPSLVNESIQPDAVGAFGAITVQFTFQEPLPARNVTLTASSTAAEIERIFPPPQQDSSIASNFTFVAAPVGGRWPTQQLSALSFRVEAVDRAGNRTEPPLQLSSIPEIDATVPEVSGATLSPSLLSAGRTRTTARFWLSEAVDPLDVEMSIGPVVDPSGGPPQGSVRVPVGACPEQNVLQSAGEGFRWTCAVDIGALDLQGVVSDATFRVEVRDGAGNVGVGATTLRLDYRAPGIVEPVLVFYERGPGNVLADPRAAKDGTTIRVRLGFDEPIDGEALVPTLRATKADAVLNFELQSTTLNSAEFSVVVDETIHGEDGAYIPELSIQDLAGNRVDRLSFASPPIEVDTTADELSVAQGQVSFVRSPVGNARAEDLVDGSGQVIYTIPAGVAFFELGPADGLAPVAQLPANTFELDGGISLLQIWASREKTDLLGAAQPAEDGRWLRSDLRLVNFDTPRAYVVGIDLAGNASEPVLIENVWWVASTAEPSVGTSRHDVGLAPRPAPPGRAVVADRTSGEVDQPDGRAVRAKAEHVWSLRSGQRGPNRSDSMAAYDTARDRVVRFGGGFRTNAADTWEWDGVEWSEVTPGPSPPGRSGHGLVYDSQRDRVVLFGGETGTGTFTRDFRDTWVFDGERWTDVTPPTGPSPSARSGHAMVFDSARGRVVLIGGVSGFPALDQNDVWEWDGQQWTDVSPSLGARAGGRGSAAYDSRRGRVVFFGDQGPSDTWEWDGTRWRHFAATTSGPSARAWHAMAYDAKRERTVLFGGYDFPGTSTVFDDTWEWDGAQWLRASVAAPPARWLHTLVFDAVRSRIVLAGGVGAWTDGDPLPESEELADVWTWDGSVWTEVTPVAVAPSPRIEHDMAYDKRRGRVVLFGGGGVTPLGNLYSPATATTWEWDGSRWVDKTPVAGPSPRFEPAIAYEPSRLRRIVLFGGIADYAPFQPFGDTWEWDGSQWTEVTPPAGRSPVARFRHDLAAGHGSGRVLLFGGADAGAFRYADTWEWDGTVWVETTPLGPVPPFPWDFVMAWDSPRARTVLFAGTVTLGSSASETWEWDGSAWRNATPSGPKPPVREAPAVALQEDRGRVVLFGGRSDTGRLSFADLWEWDGHAWVDATPRFGESPRGVVSHGLAYDSGRRRTVLFGGADLSGALLDETWELEAPTLSQAQLGLGLPPEIRQDQIEDLHVRAYCGATYQDVSGSAAVGAALYGWATGGTVGVARRPPGAWISIASKNSAGIPLPSRQTSLLEYRPSSALAAAAARSFFAGGRMYFHCRPDGDSRQCFAEVALDYMEARLKLTARE